MLHTNTGDRREETERENTLGSLERLSSVSVLLAFFTFLTRHDYHFVFLLNNTLIQQPAPYNQTLCKAISQ